MHLNRREFLHASLFLGFAIATKKGWSNKAPLSATERRDLFPQGVASGDPTANSVILWTRRPPVKDSEAKKLTVEISTSPDFKKILAGGTANISADSDWTCRFLTTDLKPNREYWYEIGLGIPAEPLFRSLHLKKVRMLQFVLLLCLVNVRTKVQ